MHKIKKPARSSSIKTWNEENDGYSYGKWYNLPFFLFHVELDVQFPINHITGIAEPERFIYLLSTSKR